MYVCMYVSLSLSAAMHSVLRFSGGPSGTRTHRAPVFPPGGDGMTLHSHTIVCGSQHFSDKATVIHSITFVEIFDRVQPSRFYRHVCFNGGDARPWVSTAISCLFTYIYIYMYIHTIYMYVHIHIYTALSCITCFNLKITLYDFWNMMFHV